MLRKLLAKDRNFKVENKNSSPHDFTFQFSRLVIAELVAYTSCVLLILVMLVAYKKCILRVLFRICVL